MKLLTISLVAFISLHFPVCLFALTAGPVVLNTADSPPYSSPDETGICDRVLKEAFKRINIPVRIVHLPSERALINANDGINDGNFVRIKGMDAIYPNLVRVPENLIKFEFVAFTKKSDFRPAGWSSLRSYNIGIIRGWKILEANISGTKSLTSVKNETSLFNLLSTNKIDIAVYDRMQGKALVMGQNYTDIHAAQPPLIVKDMYLYLHKNNKDLVPLLTAALRNIKKDGTYDKIVAQALSACCKKRSVCNYVK